MTQLRYFSIELDGITVNDLRLGDVEGIHFKDRDMATKHMKSNEKMYQITYEIEEVPNEGKS